MSHTKSPQFLIFSSQLSYCQSLSHLRSWLELIVCKDPTTPNSLFVDQKLNHKGYTGLNCWVQLATQIFHFFSSHCQKPKRQTNDNKTFSLCPNFELYSVKVTHWTDNFPGLQCQPQKKPKLPIGQLGRPSGDEKSTLSQKSWCHASGNIFIIPICIKTP